MPSWSRAAASGLVAAALVGLGVPAGATSLLLESRQLTVDFVPISRNAYSCPTCTLADWETVVLPGPAWEKADPKLLLPEVTAILPVPPEGVPASIDLVAAISGDDHIYIARVLDGVLLGNDPEFGFLSVARVERDTEFTFFAGQVVHEVTDADGGVYVLFSFDLAAAESWDVSELDGIAGFVSLPDGWRYSSRITSEEEVYASGGVATVFAMGAAATWQLVPEAGGKVPLAGALLLVGFLGARRSAAGVAGSL